MWVTRTYPKRGFYCPSGNTVTSADWNARIVVTIVTNYEDREDLSIELRETDDFELRE